MEEFLRCGRLEFGGLRLACRACGFERLVAFSCKRRGFCPSCLGRRMADLAVHLVSRVLPEVRVRQWVCSLPWGLRILCGYDKKLCADVLGAFIAEVRRSLVRRARTGLELDKGAVVQTGAVTFVQRFDSGLRLNVHFHSLWLDGVYVRARADAPLVFHTLAAPTLAEITEVAERTARRVQRVLRRHGRSVAGDDETETARHPFAEQPGLAALCGAAAAGIDLVGERAGKPTLRVVDPLARRSSEPVAVVDGFNVHAGVAVDGRDRARLERVCRYLGRPPVAQDRLERLAEGRVKYTMKKPWRDGSRALVFDPVDFVARLCAMVPPAGFHLIRFHGVLSAHATARADVVPRPDVVTPAESPQLGLFAAPQPPTKTEGHTTPAARPSRKPWAWLLKHVFAVDVSTCPRCAGAMRWVEVATTPDAIARLLASEGRRPRPPPRKSLGDVEQLELAL